MADTSAVASGPHPRRRRARTDDSPSAPGGAADATNHDGGAGAVFFAPALTAQGYRANAGNSNNLWPLLTVAMAWALLLPGYLIGDIDPAVFAVLAVIAGIGAAITGCTLMGGGVRTRDNCVKDSLVLLISHAAIFAYLVSISEKNGYALGAGAFAAGVLCEVVGSVSHIIYLNEYAGARYTLYQSQAMIGSAVFMVVWDVIRYLGFVMEPTDYIKDGAKTHRGAYMYVTLIVLQAAMSFIRIAIYAKTAPASTKAEEKE